MPEMTSRPSRRRQRTRSKGAGTHECSSSDAYEVSCRVRTRESPCRLRDFTPRASGGSDARRTWWVLRSRPRSIGVSAVRWRDSASGRRRPPVLVTCEEGSGVDLGVARGGVDLGSDPVKVRAMTSSESVSGSALAELARKAHRPSSRCTPSAYFAPEAAERYTALGIKGGLQAYFASAVRADGRGRRSRSSSRPSTTSRPTLVAQAIPSVWEVTTPGALSRGAVRRRRRDVPADARR